MEINLQTEADRLAKVKAYESDKPVDRRVLTVVTHFDPKKGEMTDKLFKLDQHEGRVAVSKLILWAMTNDIELRIRRVR